MFDDQEIQAGCGRQLEHARQYAVGDQQGVERLGITRSRCVAEQAEGGQRQPGGHDRLSLMAKCTAKVSDSGGRTAVGLAHDSSRAGKSGRCQRNPVAPDYDKGVVCPAPSAWNTEGGNPSPMPAARSAIDTRTTVHANRSAAKGSS